MIDTQPSSMGNKLKFCWFGVGVLLFLLLAFRFAGMNAVVMADEWYGSSLSRLASPADISIPSYLYTWIYHATNACGDRYLDCARVFNAFFFLAAAPFIYVVGRRFLNANLASLVALLGMLGPVNSYTAYFMPESLYFCMFWVSTWAAFRFINQPKTANAVLMGLCIGGLSLVKLHALFLVPSFTAFLLYGSLHIRNGSLLASLAQAIQYIVVMMAIAAMVRFGFGYMVAGKPALSLSGSLYSAQAGNSTGQNLHFVQLVEASLFNLRGHLSALVILFGMPIAAVLAHAFERSTPASEVSSRTALALYMALILIPLIGVTVAFTSFVAGSGYESNLRLHMRYYNFALPLLVMFAGTYIGRKNALSKLPPILIGTLVGLAIVYTVSTSLHPFLPSMVDSPDFRGISARHASFLILSTLSLLSVIAWIYRRDLGSRIFVFGFMPLYAVTASINIDHEIRAGGASNTFDDAGVFAHHFLKAQQRDELAIVGTDISGLFRAQFHIDNIRTARIIAPQGKQLDLKTLPAGITWLLLLGDYPTPPGAAVRARQSSFSLIELGAAAP